LHSLIHAQPGHFIPCGIKILTCAKQSLMSTTSELQHLASHVTVITKTSRDFVCGLCLCGWFTTLWSSGITHYSTSIPLLILLVKTCLFAVLQLHILATPSHQDYYTSYPCYTTTYTTTPGTTLVSAVVGCV